MSTDRSLSDPVERIALLSIKPLYAEAILAGVKTVEIRRRKIGDDIARIALYSTSPVQAVVGECIVKGQDIGSPFDLWDRLGRHTGISEKLYCHYAVNADRMAAIRLAEPRRYISPMPRDLIDSASRPPYSVKYLPAAAYDEAVSAWEQLNTDAHSPLDKGTSDSPLVAGVL